MKMSLFYFFLNEDLQEKQCFILDQKKYSNL